MEIAKESMVLGILFALAWMDVRKKELPVLLLALLGAVGILFQFGTNLLSWEGVLGGMLVGGVVLLIAVLSRESIGMGDGLLFCATGTCLGFRGNLQLLMFASFGAAVVALILIWKKKCTRKSRIPFVPFVLAADVLIGTMHESVWG